MTLQRPFRPQDRTVVAALVGALVGALLTGGVTVGVTVYQDRQRARDRMEDQLDRANDRALEMLSAYESVVEQRRIRGIDRPPASFAALPSLVDLDKAISAVFLACAVINPAGGDDPVDRLLIGVESLRFEVVIGSLETLSNGLRYLRGDVDAFVRFNAERRGT